MLYKRKNGKVSWFKNSYQELATYSFIGGLSCSTALKGMDRLTANHTDWVGYILIAQVVLFLIFYVYKFGKYHVLEE